MSIPFIIISTFEVGFVAFIIILLCILSILPILVAIHRDHHQKYQLQSVPQSGGLLVCFGWLRLFGLSQR